MLDGGERSRGFGPKVLGMELYLYFAGNRISDYPGLNLAAIPTEQPGHTDMS